MVSAKLLRWAEPLFPVLIIAAGVCLAPAFLMGGDENRPAAKDTERFIGKPVLVEERYLGCQIDGNLYDPAVAPLWQCGRESFAFRPSREVASLPDAE